MSKALKLNIVNTRHAEDGTDRLCSPKKGDLIRTKCKERDNEIQFCCDDMAAAWGDQVHFGTVDSGGAYDIDEVCIASCNPYPEGACWNDIPIHHCPFCGAQIILKKEEVLVRMKKKKSRITHESWEEVPVKLDTPK